MDITEIPNRYQPPRLFFVLAKFRQKEKLQFGNLEKRKKKKRSDSGGSQSPEVEEKKVEIAKFNIYIRFFSQKYRRMI